MKQIKKNDYSQQVGIIATNKSMLRANMKLFNKKNESIGEITSGGFSPILKKSIGIAYLNKFDNKNFTEIFCIIRNNKESVKISKLPFIKHNYYRGER